LSIGSSHYSFGVFGQHVSPEALVDHVRRVEALGFDFVAVADHLGQGAPFSRLTAAAMSTERLRLRTCVLNVGFWNSALLAREVATVDALSDGRFDLGLGAGFVRSEFENAGLPWQPARERIARLRETVLDVRERLSDPAYEPRPIQNPVPILVGAMSRDGLAVAVELADIVAFSALRHSAGEPAGTLRAATAEETDELVAFTREYANGRRFESDVLLQSVEIGRDPLDAAKALIEREGESEDPRVLAESPCVLERRRDRWGFTSFTTFARSAEALAKVKSELA
jgi:probable F420-dependent oxidoreductase